LKNKERDVSEPKKPPSWGSDQDILNDMHERNQLAMMQEAAFMRWQCKLGQAWDQKLWDLMPLVPQTLRRQQYERLFKRKPAEDGYRAARLINKLFDFSAWWKKTRGYVPVLEGRHRRLQTQGSAADVRALDFLELRAQGFSITQPTHDDIQIHVRESEALHVKERLEQILAEVADPMAKLRLALEPTYEFIKKDSRPLRDQVKQFQFSYPLYPFRTSPPLRRCSMCGSPMYQVPRNVCTGRQCPAGRYLVSLSFAPKPHTIPPVSEGIEDPYATTYERKPK
jgi:hypothetical protein